jgi:hypothetical protein
MSSANLDLVRSIYADWERGDFSAAEWAHPDIEFAIADGPDPRSWTGLAEMSVAWRGRLEIWESYSVEPVKFRELSGDRVLVVNRPHGRGKASGVDGDQMGSGASLFHPRGGNVTKARRVPL